MRPHADYTALRDLKVPGSDFHYAARAGDDVTEQASANAGWVVGDDVSPLHTEAMPRPDDDDDRRSWQDYAVVRGVPYAEAVNLDRDELRKRVDPQTQVTPSRASRTKAAEPEK